MKNIFNRVWPQRFFFVGALALLCLMILGFIIVILLKITFISSLLDYFFSMGSVGFDSKRVSFLLFEGCGYIFCSFIFAFALLMLTSLLSGAKDWFSNGLGWEKEDLSAVIEWLTWFGFVLVCFSLSVPKLFNCFDIFWFYVFLFGSLLLLLTFVESVYSGAKSINFGSGIINYFRIVFIVPFLLFSHRQAQWSANDFFKVNAADMPFSVVLMSIYWFCVVFYIPMLIWFFCAIFKSINFADKVGSEKGKSMHDVAYIFLVPYVVFLLATTLLLGAPKLLIQVAEFADFSDKNRCFPNKISAPVLFSSSLAGYVLVRKDEKSFDPNVRYGLEKCIP